MRVGIVYVLLGLKVIEVGYSIYYILYSGKLW